ncbi:MAG: dTDP-4-dehydrorhamnose reductase, partial [Proteobacteria bacterium]|nr:dTDP-4-dehydrorhamnose reductase [Pseudomonadota bacterium]
EIKPGLIINAAAYTAVDRAESEPELAMTINGVAPGILAEEARQLSAVMVHYSTDYVFNGNKDSPYVEDDSPDPINVYGKTKLEGERAIQAVGIPHLIFRTSWVYGTRGKNFLLTILRLAKERDELRIVDDQVGAPTWSRMIAEATAQILAQLYSPITHHRSFFTQVSGTYHLSAAGQTSWFGFAKTALEHARRDQGGGVARLIPIPASDYVASAKRPKNSLMSNRKLNAAFNVTAPVWTASLERCLSEVVL